MAKQETGFAVNVGDADKEYIAALNRLMDVPNGSFEFKIAVRTILRELNAKVQKETSVLRGAIALANKERDRIRRAERKGQVSDELYDKLEEANKKVSEQWDLAYETDVTITSPKIKHSDKPADEDLAKGIHYQVQGANGGTETKMTDYVTQYVIIYDTFVDATTA